MGIVKGRRCWQTSLMMFGVSALNPANVGAFSRCTITSNQRNMIISITLSYTKRLRFSENSWLLFLYRMGDRKTCHVNDLNSLI